MSELEKPVASGQDGVPVPPPELPPDMESDTKNLTPEQQQRIKDTVKYIDIHWYMQEEKRLHEVYLKAKHNAIRKPDDKEVKMTLVLAESNLDLHRRTRAVMIAQARYAYEENHLRFLVSISQGQKKRSEPQEPSFQGPKVPDAESARNEVRLTPEQVQMILESQKAATPQPPVVNEQ